MNKAFVIACALTLCFTTAKSQTFTNESFVANLGLGAGNLMYTDSYYSMSYPALSVSAEKGIYEKVGPGYFGIGGYIGIAGSRYRSYFSGQEYGWNTTYLSFGPRGTYHLQMRDLTQSNDFDKFDFYGGLQLNFTIKSATYISTNTFGNTAEEGLFLYPAFFAGARYYFSDNMAAFCELGYNISYATIGISFKL